MVITLRCSQLKPFIGLDPGFETQNLFTFNFDISARRYPPERSRQFFNSVLEKAMSTPGVRNAALASNPPLNGGPWTCSGLIVD